MKKDNPLKKVLRVFETLGFDVVSFREHIKLKNFNTGTVCILPNHKLVKGSTLSRILRDANLNKTDFFAKL